MRRLSKDRAIRPLIPSIEANSRKTCIKAESSSSSVQQSSRFLRTWIASLLVLSLEVDDTSFVRLSSIDLDSNILGGC